MELSSSEAYYRDAQRVLLVLFVFLVIIVLLVFRTLINLAEHRGCACSKKLKYGKSKTKPAQASSVHHKTAGFGFCGRRLAGIALHWLAQIPLRSVPPATHPGQ